MAEYLYKVQKNRNDFAALAGHNRVLGKWFELRLVDEEPQQTRRTELVLEASPRSPGGPKAKVVDGFLTPHPPIDDETLEEDIADLKARLQQLSSRKFTKIGPKVMELIDIFREKGV